MKDFFKLVFTSFLGVLAAIAFFFIFFIIIGAIAGAGGPSVSKDTVLKLDFSGAIPELSGNAETSFMDMEGGESIGLHETVKILEHAANDDKVKGILLTGGFASGGQATISSLRDALENFKAKDKFIYSYADIYSQSGYYLASVADSIYLNPNGMVDVKGFATMIPFFKETLDKVGIKMNVFYAGNFKSATEPFRRTEMSEPNRLQTKEFLESMLTLYQGEVAESRNMSVQELDDIMTNYSGKSAKSSIASRLVDRLTYKDEVEGSIKSKLGLEDDKDIKYKSLSAYNAAIELKQGSSSENKIAVVIAEGTINYGTDQKGDISEKKYLEILEDIEKNDKIKAVVLRVNSGGGSSITSDVIWHAIEKIKAKGKPVVASFGDYAASGGYYIAAGADTIVSAPNTLTGSIGVFMMFPNMSELFNEKLGIHFDDVRTHPMAVNLSTATELSDQEKQMLQESTDEIYQTFLERVSNGRGMTVDAVHEVAQGRVWTGEKAQEIGLVDVMGDLQDAIKIAGEMADLEDFRTKTFPEIEETFIDQVLKGIAQSDDLNAKMDVDKEALKLLKEYKEMQYLLTNRSPQAKLPFIMKFD